MLRCFVVIVMRKVVLRAKVLTVRDLVGVGFGLVHVGLSFVLASNG
jgi:hypothetical protein